MLGNAMRKYVMDEKKTAYNRQKRTTYDNRLRQYAARAIKDLALLAEKLPEEQQDKIFNEKNMQPLFQALFSLPALKQNDAKEKRVEFEKRRVRVIGLWHAFFSGGIISDPFYGAQLVSTDVWRALSLNMDRNLQAILYAISYHEPKQST
jgi:hypothetical protein